MIEDKRILFDSIVESCEKEVSAIRASRANPALVENIMVDAYETKTPIIQLATITIQDSRTLLIQPWDKSVSKAIEIAINNSDVGISPVNEGGLLRLIIPQLTEERRKELVKALGKKIEQFRISLRSLRDEIRDEINEAEKNKELTQDDKYKYFADLDNITTEYNKKLKELNDKKEEEIMKI